MILTVLATLLFLLEGVLPVTRAAEISVAVGGTNNVFEPEFVHAEIGDVVFFNFHQGNHSVVTSTFGKPCAPVSVVTDFISVAPNMESPQRGRWDVANLDPAWFLCRRSGHCVSGMVFAINPPSPDDFNTFKERATTAGAPRNGGNPPSNPSGTTTSTNASTSAAATTRATGTNDARLGGVDMGRQAVDAMILAVLGVVVALAL